MTTDAPTGLPLALEGIRVLEWADERGEFAGRVLSSLGAEVIKVEPRSGSRSRQIGPFKADEPGPENSLFFWSYNVGKQGIALDLEEERDREVFVRLLGEVDVFIDSNGPATLEALGLGYDSLRERFPSLIVVAITPFGLDGPWKDYNGSDLIYLALGGQMMVSGYPSIAEGEWDTPPIAPQMWQSSHVAGNYAAMDVLAALFHRDATGRGQLIDVSLHAGMASNTENHLQWYIIGKRVQDRQAQYQEMYAGDGKQMVIMLGLFPNEWHAFVRLLGDAGMVEDLDDPKYEDPVYRREEDVRGHIEDVLQRFLATKDAETIFHEAQEAGAVWAPIRLPHESLEDEHFSSRGNFADVEHPELGQTFTYPGSPWVSEQLRWRTGPRAPHLGEHTEQVLTGLLGMSDEEARSYTAPA